MLFTTNNTIPTDWFVPIDTDGKLLEFWKHVKAGTCDVVVFAVLFFLVCVSVTIYTNRNDIKPKEAKGNWIGIILTSKMAGPIIIWCHLVAAGMCCGFMATTVYAPSARTCTFLQKVASMSYVGALWTTYVLFEVRRLSIAGTKFKGWKAFVVLAVRIGTALAPIFVPLAIYAVQGTFTANACVLNVNSTVSLTLLTFDSTLSMGHLIVFIFGLQRYASLRAARILGVRSSNPLRFSNNQERDEVFRILKIARRNFKLALLSTISSFITLMVSSFVNLRLPNPDVPGAEYTLYVKEITQLVYTLDVAVNAIACLLMSSKWKPPFLRKTNPLISLVLLRGHPVVPEESDVSTLGGGMY